MEGVFDSGIAIAQSKVDCDCQLYLTPSENILQERIPLIERQPLENYFLALGPRLNVEL